MSLSKRFYYKHILTPDESLEILELNRKKELEK